MGDIELELRMYFFVINLLSEKQIGLQAGHCALRYARLYAEKDSRVWEFVDNHETWVILNGGSTHDVDGKINEIGERLFENSVDFSHYRDKNLNESLTSLCFIADERVFNRNDYPDFLEYLSRNLGGFNTIQLATTPLEMLKTNYNDKYKEWIKLIGGVKNEFLRELIKDEKLI